MKSLNRTLSLVLVLVMVFGLFGVASAATFTDAAKIQYTEAVDVMTGIGAINGYTDGTFNPAGSITREEAAKLVTYTILGADLAKSLTVTSTGFKDVEATRWSAPFITYLVSKGIINGMGDGTFAPEGKVTGYQLAKMLLCAVGYGKQGEFTGATWELNVAVLASGKGVFTGSKAASFSTAATREEAALYCFNTLTKVGLVAWSKSDELYKPVPETTEAYDTNTLFTMGESVYGLKNPTSVVNGTTGYTWVNSLGKDVSAFYSAEKVLGTITNGTAVGTVSSTASTKYIAGLGDTVKYYVNGSEITAYNAATAYAAGAMFTKNKLLYSVISAGYVAGDFTDDVDARVAEYSVKGAIVSLYAGTGADEKNIVKVGIIQKTIDVIDSAAVVVTPVLNQDSNVTVDLKTTTDITGTVKTVVGYEGLVKGDVVLYYTIGTKTYIEKAASFTGSVTTISGTKYTIAAKDYQQSGLTGFVGTVPALTDAGQTYYTDSLGYLVGKVGPAAADATKYAMVLAYAYTAANPLAGVAESSKAMLLLSDGTKGVYDLVTNAGKIQDDTLVAGNLVRYIFAADGKTITTLVKPAAVTLDAGMTVTNKAASVSIDTTATTATTYYLTSSTLFFFYNSATDYGVVTGTASVPTTTIATTKSITFEASATSVVKAMVMPAAGGVVTGTANYAYVTSATAKQTLATVSGTPTVVFTYDAIVNGAATTISTLSTAAVAVGIHTYTTDSNTYCTISTPTTLAEDNMAVTVADAAYFVCDGAVYNITAKTAIYKASFAADKTTITGLTVANIELSASKTTKAYVVDDGAGNALFVIWYAV